MSIEGNSVASHPRHSSLYPPLIPLLGLPVRVVVHCPELIPNCSSKRMVALLKTETFPWTAAWGCRLQQYRWHLRKCPAVKELLVWSPTQQFNSCVSFQVQGAARESAFNIQSLDLSCPHLNPSVSPLSQRQSLLSPCTRVPTFLLLVAFTERNSAEEVVWFEGGR